MTQPHDGPIPLIGVRDARATGSYRALLRTGERVRPGVFADAEAYAKLPPWERYRARVHAVALRSPGVIFAFESAAVRLGLPIFGEPRDIHVYDPDRPRSRRYGDVVVHTSIDAKDVVRVGSEFTTSLIDTTVDLMRALPPAYGLAVADAARSARTSPFTAPSVAELRNRADGQQNPRGRRILDLLWAEIDSAAESACESVSRAAIAWLGFARPETQVEFRFEGRTDRADFWWRDVRTVGEADGYAKYVADSPESTARLMIREKKREDRLRRRVTAFIRWDWATAVTPSMLGDRLAAAGVPRVRPSRPALLATLGRNPRSR